MRETTHRLDFLNPDYHYGDNVTVRRGDKWYIKARTGDNISIYKTGDNTELCRGVITWIHHIPFMAITIGDILAEHDQSCTTPFGLVYAMLSAYPEFTLSDNVTVIHFNIK